MTQELVVDTSVFIVSLIDEAQLDDDDKKRRPLAISYLDGLEKGDYLVHLPMIALVEIARVASQKVGAGPTAAINHRLEQWRRLGLIKLYDLEESIMRVATDLVMQHNKSRKRSLSAPDATFVGLAEELGITLVTFEKYMGEVSQNAVVPA